jgi:sensor histidine kinase regulating citrate/malate metabolism
MRIQQESKFMLLMGSLLFIAFSLLAVFIIVEEQVKIDRRYQEILLDTARIIADDDQVIDYLKNNDPSVDNYVDKYYENVEVLSLVIILDMNNIRLTHPNDELLGAECDQVQELGIFDGEEFIGNYQDCTNEQSIRVFVPIFDNDTQIGVASTGVLEKSVQDEKQAQMIPVLLGFGFGFVASLLALYWLNKRFQKELFGFSPTEIALLYAENKSIIEQLNEAIISVDQTYHITTLNHTAQNMFGLEKDTIGKNAKEVVPFVDFESIMKQDLHIENKYRLIEQKKYLMNAFPLYLDDQIIGATAIFRSHYEIDALLDQISGYQQIAKALRSQKHEFQNKLHVVLGLIKMKDYPKAENYIMENVYTTNLASDYYTSRIKDDRVLALFVGKEIQSKEYNASLLLTSDSYLTKLHQPINSDDIVLVLGNLIDNSFEAYIHNDLEEKKVVVDIFEDEDQVKMTVIDQAGGISPEVVDKMFERGVSTKNGESRGTGLSLVNEIVSLYQGEKNVISSKNETKIEIILTKVIS